MPTPAMTPEQRKAYEIAMERIEACRQERGTVLNLSGLGLSSLPPEIGQLSALKKLFLHDNPLLAIPPSVLGPERSDFNITGQKPDPAPPAEILDYYFSIVGGEGRALREVKVIFVGHGEVGKSSMVDALLGKNSRGAASARTASPSPRGR